MSVPPVEVRRLLAAPLERVFAAFAQPSLVARWLRPSPDVKLTVLAFDFRPGGAYRFAYDVSDAQRMVVGGTFRTIVAPSHIVFSWLIEPPDEHAGIDSEVTVQLMPRGASTELTIRHAKLDRVDANLRHDQGWRGALDLLEARLRSEAERDQAERGDAARDEANAERNDS
jgi:uncharacterized protein YndB with AHSA1/START domain